MPTFLDLCKMFFITIGFVFVLSVFGYVVIRFDRWVCYRKFKRDKKMLRDCVQKSKRRKSTIHFHEILEHKN